MARQGSFIHHYAVSSDVMGYPYVLLEVLTAWSYVYMLGTDSPGLYDRASREFHMLLPYKMRLGLRA